MFPRAALTTSCSLSPMDSIPFVCSDISIILALIMSASQSVRPSPRYSPTTFLKDIADVTRTNAQSSNILAAFIKKNLEQMISIQQRINSNYVQKVRSFKRYLMIDHKRFFQTTQAQDGYGPIQSTTIHLSSRGSPGLITMLQLISKSQINTPQTLPSPALTTGCSISPMFSTPFVFFDTSMILALMKLASQSVRPSPRSSFPTFLKENADAIKMNAQNNIILPIFMS